MRFKLTDTDQYPLQVENAPERFWHLATIHYGAREFIFYADIFANSANITSPPIKYYVEEITGGHLEVIRDNELWQALCDFLVDKGLNSDKMLHFLNSHRTRIINSWRRKK